MYSFIYLLSKRFKNKLKNLIYFSLWRSINIQLAVESNNREPNEKEPTNGPKRVELYTAHSPLLSRLSHRQFHRLVRDDGKHHFIRHLRPIRLHKHHRQLAIFRLTRRSSFPLLLFQQCL